MKTSAKRAGRRSPGTNPADPKEPDGRSLERYRRKRDPRATNEPFSAERAGSALGTVQGAFVVHLHAATRRHYDLRLQVGNVLKSFAVPRGPSLNPGDKRLAVNTEDHPLAYLDFEDVIPKGNYGAGPMITWDTGQVRYLESTAEEGIRNGKLDFILTGHKLRGRFALVQTGHRAGRAPDEANQWLLIKKADAFASMERDIIVEEPRSVLSGLGVEELANKSEIARAVEREAAELGASIGTVSARSVVPMLCQSSGTESGLGDPGRLYELKLDGVRILAERQAGDVALWYRTHRPATSSYPEIVRAMRALIAERIVLDGEILAFDESGRPSFHRLASRIHALRPRDVAIAQLEVPVVYVVFDVLEVGDRDLRRLPLVDRKRLLERLVPDKGVIRRLDHFEGNGHALFAFCKEQGLEGVVGKRREAPYRPGPRRTDDWVKFKCEREADFVVVGWVEGKGGGQKLGSLELATYSGDRLVLRGRVGSGLDDAAIRKLSAQLRELEIDESPAEGKPNGARGKRHFAKPRIVVSVQFSGWTEDGGLRHPVFRGVRSDMEPEGCTQAPSGEILDHPGPVEAPPPSAPAPGPPRAAGLTGRESRVAVTNRDKVFWPEEGYTKGDLIDYYAAVSDVMLPLLADRPVVLVRYPDGIHGKSFYQWNVPHGTPDWLRRLRFRDDEGKEGKNTFIVEDGDGLVYLANLGCIPIHILACRASSVEHCDFLTIDFDLGGRPFQDAITLALTLKQLLDDLGLSGYPKTSGQSGLHVLIPVGAGIPFAAAKLLLELIGRLVQVQHADISTLERRVSARGDRVYIDTGQTGRSRTIVAPYSVRAHPGATVSMPLFWDEVHRALDPSQYTMFTALDFIADRGDPMAGFQDAHPDISRAMSRLDAKLDQWGLRS